MAAHSTNVKLDIIQINLAFIIINFIAIPLSRDIDVDATYLFRSILNNILSSAFIAFCYYILKIFYAMYVNTKLEKRDHDKLLNKMNEGVLIISKDETDP